MKQSQEENLHGGRKIRTVSGLYVDVFDPDPNTLIIEDMAHALSMQCRFGGHLPKFYSVAEHSINCAYFIDFPNRLQALMHDASEAYLLDIPSPIKSGLDNYKAIENQLMLVIADKFGFNWPLDKSVKEIDEYMLVWEWEEIMLGKRQSDVELACWSPAEAKERFLNLFKELTA